MAANIALTNGIEVSTVNLTIHGIKAVLLQYECSVNSVEKAQKLLDEAEQYKAKLEKVLTCEHEIQCEGGIEVVAMTCKKCGFTWYD